MKTRFLPAFVLLTVMLRAQGVGYVVDNARPRLQVLDLGSRSIIFSIPTGSESSEIYILPDNRRAYVSNQADNNVVLLDLFTNQRIKTIPTGQAPGSLASTPDGRFLYATCEGSNEVTVIDTSAQNVVTSVPVGTTPVQVNLSPNGRLAYVVNQDDTHTGTVSVIDTNRNQIWKTLSVGLRPSQIAIAPNQTTAYVVNKGSDSLSVVNLAQNVVTGSVAVGRGPVSVAFSTDGSKLYAINRDGNSVSVVDTQQNREITQIPVGAQPAAMAITFDSKFGYVSNMGSNTVTLLDLTLNTAEEDITVGAQPFSLQLDPNENFLYVTNLGSSTVSVIDVNTDRVSATIPVGGAPVQFQLLNAPTLLELAPNMGTAGTRLTLNGEGFLPSSTVSFVTTNPPRTIPVAPLFLDSQGLQVATPGFVGNRAVVSVANPDGSSSEILALEIGTATAAILSGGVVEGAGFARAPYPISGGSIVSVFGSFPGVVKQSASGFPLPTTLGNATVTFNGIPAPLIYAASDQINLVAPIRLLALDSVRVAVTAGFQTSRAEKVNVAAAAPGIFFNPADGAGAFLHPDYLPVTAAKPARRGETIIMYLTGLGNTSPPPIDGEQTPIDVFPATLLPTVTVGGTQAHYTFSGLAPLFSGLYQINFEVPQSAPPASEVPVSVSAGVYTSNTVKLAVQ